MKQSILNKYRDYDSEWMSEDEPLPTCLKRNTKRAKYKHCFKLSSTGFKKDPGKKDGSKRTHTNRIRFKSTSNKNIFKRSSVKQLKSLTHQTNFNYPFKAKELLVYAAQENYHNCEDISGGSRRDGITSRAKRDGKKGVLEIVCPCFCGRNKRRDSTGNKNLFPSCQSKLERKIKRLEHQLEYEETRIANLPKPVCCKKNKEEIKEYCKRNLEEQRREEMNNENQCPESKKATESIKTDIVEDDKNCENLEENKRRKRGCCQFKRHKKEKKKNSDSACCVSSGEEKKKRRKCKSKKSKEKKNKEKICKDGKKKRLRCCSRSTSACSSCKSCCKEVCKREKAEKKKNKKNICKDGKKRRLKCCSRSTSACSSCKSCCKEVCKREKAEKKKNKWKCCSRSSNSGRSSSSQCVQESSVKCDTGTELQQTKCQQTTEFRQTKCEQISRPVELDKETVEENSCVLDPLIRKFKRSKKKGKQEQTTTYYSAAYSEYLAHKYPRDYVLDFVGDRVRMEDNWKDLKDSSCQTDWVMPLDFIDNKILPSQSTVVLKKSLMNSKNNLK